MTHDDPYAPPNSVLGTHEEVAQPLRRPTSHKWVIFALTIMIVGFSSYIVEARGVNFWYGILFSPAAIIAFGGMVFRRYSKATFFSVSVVLGAFVIYAFWVAHVRVSSHGGKIRFWEDVWPLAMLTVLLYRFTFGRASREYYGFPVSPKSK